MLNTILAYRAGIGQALGVIAATTTVVVFEQYLGLAWYISVPVAVLAYVSMPVLWIRFLDGLIEKNRR